MACTPSSSPPLMNPTEVLCNISENDYGCNWPASERSSENDIGIDLGSVCPSGRLQCKPFCAPLPSILSIVIILSDLPWEVLSNIFVQACSDPGWSLDALSSITRVCKIWYQISYGTSSLWADICIAPGRVHRPLRQGRLQGFVTAPKTLHHRIKLSRSRPLKFNIYFPAFFTNLGETKERPLYNHLLKIVLAEHTRIQDLSVTIFTRCEDFRDAHHPYCIHGITSMIMRYFASNPAYILQHLGIMQGPATVGDSECSLSPAVSDGWSLPRLRTLNIRGQVSRLLPAGAWAGLRNLEILGSIWSTSQLIENLEKCSELKSLTVELPFADPNPTEREVTLESLHSLYLINTCSRILRFLYTPVLHYLRVYGDPSLQYSDFVSLLGSERELGGLRSLNIWEANV